MKQETEFFHDMRQYVDNAWSGGVDINVEFFYVPFLLPIAIGWPGVGYSRTQLRSAVSNKIIYRCGVL